MIGRVYLQLERSYSWNRRYRLPSRTIPVKFSTWNEIFLWCTGCAAVCAHRAGKAVRACGSYRRMERYRKVHTFWMRTSTQLSLWKIFSNRKFQVELLLPRWVLSFFCSAHLFASEVEDVTIYTVQFDLVTSSLHLRWAYCKVWVFAKFSL